MERNTLIILLNPRFKYTAIKENILPPNVTTFFVKNYAKWQYIYIFDDKLAVTWKDIKPFIKNEIIFFIAFLEPISDSGTLQSLTEMYTNTYFNNIFHSFLDKFIGHKLYCLFVNCYGFYIHQHFTRLPKGSVLITLSDYVTGTSQFHSADRLLSILNNLGNKFSFDKLLLLWLKDHEASIFSLTCPVIFISYYKNNKPYMDCLLRYTKFTFVREPLYLIYKLKPKNIYIFVKMLRTFYYFEVNAKNILELKKEGIIIHSLRYLLEEILGEILDYIMNLYSWRVDTKTKISASPLDICNTINTFYNGGSVESYRNLSSLFSRTLYNVNPYKYDSLFVATAATALRKYFTVKPKILIDLINYLEMKENIIERITNNNVNMESNTSKSQHKSLKKK